MKILGLMILIALQFSDPYSSMAQQVYPSNSRAFMFPSGFEQLTVSTTAIGPTKTGIDSALGNKSPCP